MKKYTVLILVLIAFVGCKQRSTDIPMKVSTASNGYLLQNVAITSDTELVVCPDIKTDKWAVYLIWSSSTAGTSSSTIVTIREGLDVNRLQYYVSTDTLSVDTTTGVKYWKGSDFCSTYLGINIGTYSGTTTTFSIYYSTK
jgi:hypothetical protein